MTGIALAEIYEDDSSSARLVNLSSRGVVSPGASVMIPAFVTSTAGTTGPKKFLIRGVGPALTQFGVANVLAAIPITPGGLGYVDTSYIGTLVGFGAPARLATLGVASYRFAQFFFPILLGAMLYLSLRVGPWSISRRERLIRLRDLAEEETQRGESRIDFQLRFPTRDDTGELIRRPPTPAKVEPSQERFRRWRRDRKP